MSIATISAKPYAKAVFDLALKEGALDRWSQILKLLAKAVFECEERGILGNPRVKAEEKVTLFAELVEEFPEACNLIQLLAGRKKLRLLPGIAFDYQELLFAHNKILEVQVVSAVELTAEQKDRLLEKVKEVYQQEVLFQYRVDNTLIGGVAIYLADRVVDSSIKGMLQRLKVNLLTKSDHA